MGFEAGVFQASPVVVTVSGVQGQLGRDVETDTGDDTKTQAADTVAFVIGRFAGRSFYDLAWLCNATTWFTENSRGFFSHRMNLMFNVSVGDARTDIGFEFIEFIVEFEIVNGG
ncbi:Uncharacterised protein [Neisseria meningitidis]|nr:Uncharacterised protein [Neisseria meningitidis]